MHAQSVRRLRQPCVFLTLLIVSVITFAILAVLFHPRVHIPLSSARDTNNINSNIAYYDPESASSQRCPHVLLFTQARHGSTWFIDSAEKCRFSKRDSVQRGVYGKRVYWETELWHIHPSPLQNMSSTQAHQYLLNNCSVKIFPPALHRAASLLNLIEHIPIVVLRRDVHDSFSSYLKARDTGKWALFPAEGAASIASTQHHLNGTAANKTKPTSSFDEQDKEWKKWEKDTESFFTKVDELLHSVNKKADWLWFEHVRSQQWIRLPRSNCVIRNCNFGSMYI